MSKTAVKQYTHLQQLPSKDQGFTLMELIVVIGIMGIISTIFIVNIAGQRVARNLNIAQNELSTNIKKIQSYTLSARGINNDNISVQYYVIRLDKTTASSSSYTLQAMYNVSSAPKLQDIETIKLPGTVVISNLTINLSNGSSQSPNCALAAFAAPFGRIYMSNGCSVNSSPISATDSYYGVVNYPAGGTASLDSDLIIELKDPATGQTRKLLVRGLSGLVCPTLDGNTCQ